MPAWNAQNQFHISKNSKEKLDLNCKYVTNYAQETKVNDVIYSCFLEKYCPDDSYMVNILWIDRYYVLYVTKEIIKKGFYLLHLYSSTKTYI